MHKQQAPARAFALFALASLLLAGIPALPFFAGSAQAAPVLFAESWDTGGAGWTTTPGLRIGVDPTISYSPLASLVVDSQAKGQTLKTERNLALSFADAPGYVVSFAFRNEHAASKSSSWFTMRFPDGGHVKLDVTHGEPHNRVRLYTNGTVTMPLTNAAGATWMYADDTWYEARIKVDLVNNKVRAEVWNPATGARLANSTSLPIYASARDLGVVSFEGTYNGDDPLATEAPWPMNYDNLQVRLPDPPSSPALLATPGPGLGEVSLSWQPPADDGGVPVLQHNVYRGNAAGSVTTLLGTTTNRSFVVSGMQNGESHYYGVRAVNAMGEGAMSNAALATTFNVPSAPRSLVAAMGANVGEVRLTWQAPLSNGGASVSAYRVYRGSEAGNATLLAELGNVLAYTDTHRPNGTRWYYNVTALNFVGQSPSSNEASSLPKPDAASTPAAIVLRPDPWWTDQPRELNFSYSVAASQCAPAESCPVAHEWRVYQDGSPSGVDGILLASGTNAHSGHAETTWYDVGTIVTPTGLDGTHRLKVAVNAREGSTSWSVSSIAFQNGLPQPDPRCNAEPGYSTYIMPHIATPNASGWQYAKTYGYKLNGTVSAHRAVFVDGCPANGPLGPGDGHYEIGYGGILLDQSDVGGIFQVLDSTGNAPQFVLGTDVDASGLIGDSPLDCFQGPFRYVANLTCAPDTNGKIVVIFLPATPPGELPVNTDPIWGRYRVCTPLAPICFQTGPCDAWCMYQELWKVSATGLLFQADSTADGLGDAWQHEMEEKAQAIDKILGPASDQEFPAGQPCVPTSPGSGSCIGKGVGDKLFTVTEFRWGTIPIGAVKACVNGCVTLLANARDWDNDSWEDGEEQPYWNNPDNDNVLSDPTWETVMAAPRDPDANANFDGDTPGTVFDPDNDNDGLIDGVEFKTWGTYPEFADSDCAPDTACSSPGPSYYSSHSGKPGTGDQIDDRNESLAWPAGKWNWNFDGDSNQNNLLDPDADADGLLDGLEFNTSVGGKCPALCTDPGDFDSDDDGLLDGGDVRVYENDYRIGLFIPAGIAYTREGSSPFYVYRFYGEATAGTSRTNPDTDGDGLPDGWEYKYTGDPLASDATADPDKDGYTNRQEYSYLCNATPCPATPVHWGGTNPRNPDSDADALLDGSEDRDKDGMRDDNEPSPLEPDSDADGLKDGAEANQPDYYLASQPWKADTDGDGLTDYQEVVTYAAKGISPHLTNSDGCCGTPQEDTLTDYQEVVLYRTNASGRDLNQDGLPDGWDTDGDGLADGQDSNPTRYDSPPGPRTLPPLNPRPQQYESYVTFSKEGYIDVYVKDTHGSEAEIELVYVKVELEGIVQGVAGSIVKINEEARRLDEAGTWGARIPLPEHMSKATRETFTLTVVSSNGGTANQGAAYGGTFTEPMDAVTWKPQNDLQGKWEKLDVHESIPKQDTTAAGFNGAPLLPTLDPHSLSLDEVFAAFGDFTVYRLKPRAVLATELPDYAAEFGNTSAFAIAHPINATLGPENASAFVDFTYYEDAFELVPLTEPGPYLSLAGGFGSFRAPKFIHTGVMKAWNGLVTTTKNQGASFLFGSDDPRANGAILGDIASGILVYGDVRDCFFKQDAITVALGCIGIALTFVGPQADGPFAAFKAGVKVIAGMPTVGAKVALKFVTDVKLAVDAAKAANNPLAALGFLADQCSIVLWLKANRDKAIPFDHVHTTVPASTLNPLKNQVPGLSALAQDLEVALGSGAATEAMLTRFTQTSVMFTSGGEDTLRRLVAMTEGVRAEGHDAARFARALDTLRNVENAGPGTNSWIRDVEPRLLSENANGYPYIFEAFVLADAKNGLYLVTIGPGGQTASMVLTKLDQRYTDVLLKDGTPKTVVIEGVGTLNGKFAIIDAKSGARLSAGQYGPELEKQVALVKREGGGHAIWVIKVQRPQSLWDLARQLEQEPAYSGVKISFIDEATKRELTDADFI